MRPGGKKTCLTNNTGRRKQLSYVRSFTEKKKYSQFHGQSLTQNVTLCFFPFVYNTALALLKSHALGHFQSYRESLHKQQQQGPSHISEPTSYKSLSLCNTPLRRDSILDFLLFYFLVPKWHTAFAHAISYFPGYIIPKKWKEKLFGRTPQKSLLVLTLQHCTRYEKVW